MKEPENDQKNYDKWWDAFESNNAVDPGTLYRNNYIIGKIKSLSANTVADIGCGAGQLIKNILFSTKGIKLSGFDVSKKIIEKNKQRYKNVDFFCLNLNDEIPSSIKSRYDLVISSEVIEHLKNWQKSIETMSKLMAKNGYIIITTQAGKIYRHHKCLGHLKHFRKGEIVKELKKHNIKIIESRYSGWPFMNLKNVSVNLFYKDIGKSLSKNQKQGFLNKLIYKSFKIFYDISSRKRGPQIFILGKKL